MKRVTWVSVFFLLFSSLASAQDPPRNAHYVASTHWDREWYESFQGFRMRLVSMLDEVFDTFEKDPAFRTFLMDGQTVPLYDYLEIRPENRPLIERYVRQERLLPGPWYVQPDEWLVSGESLVRNLQLGMKLSRELDANPAWGGFSCDQFGHVGQLPQIYDQLGIPMIFAWRGLQADEKTRLFNWRAPDGTVLPTYRFGRRGYCTYYFDVRNPETKGGAFDLEKAVDRLTAHVLAEAALTPTGPIFLYDGGDHMEIEPRTSRLIALANDKLAVNGILIKHSDPESYMQELLAGRKKITETFSGEMRETRSGERDGHLIPGVLSSRIHLKQKNALCEDELCLWAEPFSTFSSLKLGREYPESYLQVAWKHLLENHPHDSMCGCSIDQVHQDMLYRFDQSFGISSRLTAAALKEIACAASPAELPEGSMLLAVFNSTAADIDEPLDVDIPLPYDWPKRFAEFFGYEQKFSFRLYDSRGAEIPYQLVAQKGERHGFSRRRYNFPSGDTRRLVQVTARLHVPAFGYTTITVRPAEGPTRHLGSMVSSARAIENEFLRVEVNPNGTLDLTDKRTGGTFRQLLTFEDRADIGDGWYHGIAVNDRICLSSAGAADVALVADGIGKATFRITVSMNVPKEFDFKNMERSNGTAPLKIVSDVTLRQGSDRLEVETSVENNVLDHRLRVLLPTNLGGETYMASSAFDAVERPVALARDNESRDELDVETRPQISWTAFGDGKAGLALVSRGLPESSVQDNRERTLALTLLRAFRRAVFSNDNPGGQIQGEHSFRYDIVPYDGKTPLNRLFLLGQRVNSPCRQAEVLPIDLAGNERTGTLPGEHSFLGVTGNGVVSSLQRTGNGTGLRLFNPHGTSEIILISPAERPKAVKCVTLDGRDDPKSAARLAGNAIELTLPAKRITTVVFE